VRIEKQKSRNSILNIDPSCPFSDYLLLSWTHIFYIYSLQFYHLLHMYWGYNILQFTTRSRFTSLRSGYPKSTQSAHQWPLNQNWTVWISNSIFWIKKKKICTFGKLSNLNSMVANALSVWMQGYSNQREFVFEKRSGKRFKETWKTLGQSAPLALKKN
jgi:hypothetical protein